MSLVLDDLHKRYGDTLAVAGVSLELAEGETLALLGPSGCGKSTLLRLLAGLEPPDRGRLLLDGEEITARPPQRRRFGMVFQDYALFPHLSVEHNIAFGLVELGWPRARRRARVAELLELVGLTGFETRRPAELSGGQQQRVALARALAPEPTVLLLDEPLSNLDQSLRASLQEELRQILGEVHVRAVYVTHDQSEAFALGRRVAVMRSGAIRQVDRPDALHARPADPWVARFLGHRNVYAASELARAALPFEGPALLRGGLLRLGGPVAAEVRWRERVGGLERLRLALPDWGIEVVWEGFDRDLPEPLTPGDRPGLEIPDEAWQPLGSPGERG